MDAPTRRPDHHRPLHTCQSTTVCATTSTSTRLIASQQSLPRIVALCYSSIGPDDSQRSNLYVRPRSTWTQQAGTQHSTVSPAAIDSASQNQAVAAQRKQGNDRICLRVQRPKGHPQRPCTCLSRAAHANKAVTMLQPRPTAAWATRTHVAQHVGSQLLQ